jgi:hypothetical protein
MDEDQLFFRPTKPPPAGISEDEYRCAEGVAFIKAQLARLRREMELFVVMLGGAAVAI